MLCLGKNYIKIYIISISKLKKAIKSLHLKCSKSQHIPMALHKWYDSFKEWKSLIFTNRNPPFFTRQKPTQPSIEDQGKDRTHHHNVRHEMKRGFLDLDPTLIGCIVWPLWIDMGFWNYVFGEEQIIAKICWKLKNLNTMRTSNKERKIFTLDICLWCSFGKVWLWSYFHK